MTDTDTNTLAYDTADHWTSGTYSGAIVASGYDGHGRRVSRTDDGVRSDFWYDFRGLTYETGASTATYDRKPGGKLLSVGQGTYRR